MMDAAITVPTALCRKQRIPVLVRANGRVGALLDTAAALDALILVQMDFERHQPPCQLVWRVDNASELESGDITLRRILFQPRQEVRAIAGNLSFKVFFKREKPVDERGDDRTVAGRAPIRLIHDGNDVFLLQSLCQNLLITG